MKRLPAQLLAFESYLKGLGHKPSTIKARIATLERFIKQVTEQDKSTPSQIKGKDILSFLEKLKQKKSTHHRPFKASTLNKYLRDLNAFFRYLAKDEVILVNPMTELSIKQKEPEYSKEIFTTEEINRFLEAIDPKTDKGLRDRTIFELLYASGLRTFELIQLNLYDIDLSERTLTVHKGKGGKDRYVPFSVTAANFLKSYISTARSRFLSQRYEHLFRMEDEKALFISAYGRLKWDAIQKRFQKTLEAIHLKRPLLTLHSIRHSTATHLLEAGADVRYVQELLGHEDIQTTVKYTHLMTDHLKKAYKSTHPRENEFKTKIDQKYLDDLKQLKEDIIEQKRKNIKYNKPRPRKNHSLV